MLLRDNKPRVSGFLVEFLFKFLDLRLLRLLAPDLLRSVVDQELDALEDVNQEDPAKTNVLHQIERLIEQQDVADELKQGRQRLQLLQ